MTGKLTFTLLLSAQLFSVALTGTVATGPNLFDWGMGAPSNAACPQGTGTLTAGWYVDRTYSGNQVAAGLCFARQVWCNDYNSVDSAQYRTCDVGSFYVADGAAATCVDSTSSAARLACGISIDCSPNSMGVYVTDGAAFDQAAGGFQLGAMNTIGACDLTDNGGYFQGSFDLTSSNWAQCDVSRSLVNDGGAGIMYEVVVARDTSRTGLTDGTGDGTQRYEEEHGGVIVTREKCFMMTARCYYNADGTAMASFFPSAPNTLTESDKETIDFELVPRTCGMRGPGAAPIAPVTEFVNDRVCFRGEIVTRWHTNIRVSIRKCWASNQDPNAADGTYSVSPMLYPLSDMALGATDLDATFGWNCHAQTSDTFDGSVDQREPMEEDFSFDAFRFQQAVYDDPTVNYAQTIYVICDINACEVDDFTSTECTPKSGCSDYAAVTRQRRAAEEHSTLAQLTSSRIVHSMNVLPRAEKKRELVTYNLLSDTLALSMFAVGCVLAVVAVGLLAVLRRSRAQIRYGMMHR